MIIHQQPDKLNHPSVAFYLSAWKWRANASQETRRELTDEIHRVQATTRRYAARDPPLMLLLSSTWSSSLWRPMDEENGRVHAGRHDRPSDS